MEFHIGWLILLTIIGAILGGGTNIIAIHMLFRPHRAMYIGSYQIPFTPGLIPKRRNELAVQLGKLVEEHLVTPEGIQKRINQGPFMNDLETKIQQLLHDFLHQELSFDEWLKTNTNRSWSVTTIKDAIRNGLYNKLNGIALRYQSKPLEEIIPPEWNSRLEEYIPRMTTTILDKVEVYVISDEGRGKIDEMISRFFETRGSVGGFLGRMVNRSSLTSIMIKELTKLLHEDKTKELLNDWLKREYHQYLKKSPDEILENIEVSNKVEKMVDLILSETPIIRDLERPMKEWAYQYEDIIITSIVPSFMSEVTKLLEKHLKNTIKRIGIRNIVEEQVNTFPLQRLETILILVAKRELKMIAILGALIGGLVGLFQGLLIMIVL
ncbi:DUF445 domain-containing protein [Litchfieldia alkalitelluris]|nr:MULTISPECIES: DUF445 family protein [Bacillaceae]